METLAKLCAADVRELLLATPIRIVDLNDPAKLRCGDRLVDGADVGREAKAWSSSRSTSSCKGKQALLQPAIKCRGPEYLRIIYGPEYLLPENLERLRATRRWRQAFAGLAGIRPGHRSPGTIRPQGAVAAQCTNASSACWPWKANRSIRGCRSGVLSLVPLGWASQITAGPDFSASFFGLDNRTDATRREFSLCRGFPHGIQPFRGQWLFEIGFLIRCVVVRFAAVLVQLKWLF